MPTSRIDGGRSRATSLAGWLPLVHHSQPIIVANRPSGSGGFGSTLSATNATLSVASTTSITIPPSTGWPRRLGTGRTRRFIDTSARVYCRPIGAATERQTTTTLASGRTDPDFASLHPGYKTGALDRNPSSAIPALHGRCGRRIRCSRRHIGGYPRASAPARGWRARRGSAGRETRTAWCPRTRRAH
ncbi:hypothetical protein ACVIHD_001913 [Bradyrhizobium embrapense]